MKLFTDKPNRWDTKVNFVDSANTLVGYDYSGQCCEQFGYALLKEIPEDCSTLLDNPTPDPDADTLDPYLFDTKFFRNGLPGNFDGGGAVAFRLVAEDKPDLYLILWNHQNGYYSHRFECNVGGTVIHSGEL